jgi:transposase
VAEQNYKAVLAVIADGRTVTEVARDLGVSRQTMHLWLARYEEEGLEGLSNRSHRPAHSPHQMRRCGKQRCWRRAGPSPTGVRADWRWS